MFHRAIIIFLAVSSIQVRAQEVAGDSCRHLEVEDFYIRMHSCLYPLVLDTRSYREFRRERLPGAILMESRAELEKMADSLDRDQPLFLYCENDNRSLVACRMLWGMGFRNVYDLKGGLDAWKLTSYSLDRERIRKKPRR
jgi:rhodanese-related sulfurtransferase